MDVASAAESRRVPMRVAAPLRHQMVDILREAIASGEYKPGQRLVERELCAQYSVSRTLVRETLRHLEAEGFVGTEPGVGPIVSRVTVEEAEAIYEVRGALEALAAKLFTERASEALKDELTDVARRIEAFSDAEDTSQLLVLKDEFYEILFRGAGNPAISRLLHTLHSRVRFLRSLSLSSQGRASHTVRELNAIVREVRRGDGDAAAAACERHVNNAAKSALGRLRAVEQATSG